MVARPPAAGQRAAQELALARRVLSDELRDGCRDRKVTGGLERFLVLWRGRVRQAGAEPLRTMVDAIVDTLAGYRGLAPSQRQARLEQAIGWLERTAGSAEPGQTPAVPAAPPRPRPPAERYPLDTSIEQVRGVGPARAKLLARLGISTYGDLLQYLPNRYDHYPPPEPAAQLFMSQAASFEGTVRGVEQSFLPRGLRRISVELADATGLVTATWLRGGRSGFQFRQGDQLAVSGPLSGFGRHLVFDNPAWEYARGEPVHTRRIVPVYPLTQGLYDRWLRELVKQAVDAHAGELPDPLPERRRREHDLLTYGEAVRQVHFPDSPPALEAARRRLAFDELLLLQIVALRRRLEWRGQRACALRIPEEALGALRRAQPFEYTGAQQRVMAEIFADLASSAPMSRLLQGEVGSGKTAVAAATLLVAVTNGKQGALMAPTEILAEQHLRSLRALFERATRPLADVGARAPRVELLVGSQAKRERQRILDGLASGEADVVVGTQAVIQESVEFHDLAVSIVDEQHRFGVRQRVTLRQKGTNPHLLVMTATPIPRTLALCLHGDLDRSLIDELPPGRKPINTQLLLPLERPLAYEVIRREVRKGRQAFIICPLVEGSERLEVRAATEEYERLAQEDLAGLRLALLHGRLRSAEKDATMRSFAAGDFDVLVSTSVVEVGVDVPNATVMVIEGAERFGMAQLHQFRGRVGRGPYPAHCLLLTDADEPAALERLQAVAASADGLELAEFDLRQRGPGDYFGVRQSGLPELRVANLDDADLLLAARRTAADLLLVDPGLVSHEHSLLGERLAALLARTGEPN